MCYIITALVGAGAVCAHDRLGVMHTTNDDVVVEARRRLRRGAAAELPFGGRIASGIVDVRYLYTYIYVYAKFCMYLCTANIFKSAQSERANPIYSSQVQRHAAAQPTSGLCSFS